MTQWKRKRPPKRFNVGDRVKWSSKTDASFIEEFGNGFFTVVYSYIETGGVCDDCEEGHWWGDELLVIGKKDENGTELVSGSLYTSKAVWNGFVWIPRFSTDSDDTVRDHASVGPHVTFNAEYFVKV